MLCFDLLYNLCGIHCAYFVVSKPSASESVLRQKLCGFWAALNDESMSSFNVVW